MAYNMSKFKQRGNTTPRCIKLDLFESPEKCVFRGNIRNELKLTENKRGRTYSFPRSLTAHQCDGHLVTLFKSPEKCVLEAIEIIRNKLKLIEKKGVT